MPDFKIMAVTGNPILHSKSPYLFNPLLKEAGTYTRLAADSAYEALYLFKELGLTGMSVTAPFKKEIMAFLPEVTSQAAQIDGVNCIANREGKLVGYNTDLYGVVDSFTKAGINLKGKKAVVIGAGGAAKATVCGLMEAGAEVIIVNRTKANADILAKQFNCQAADLALLPELLKLAEVVVSTLAADHNLIQEEWLSNSIALLDADYKQAIAYKMAVNQNAVAIRGEEWLINQALPAYQNFTNLKPDEELMRQAVYHNFKALNKERIALVGMMGCGKSSVGRKLASMLKWKFIDTDQLIIKKANKTIANIFKEDGEEAFRKIEKEVLSQLTSLNKVVISTGGGMVLDRENRQTLKENFLPILLYADIETSYKRTKHSDRPLLKTDNPKEKLSELWKARKNFYLASSEMVVNTNNKEISVIAGKIYDEISRIL